MNASKAGCGNVGPKFFCAPRGCSKMRGMVFSAYEMRSRVIVGSNTYWISSFVHDQSSSSCSVYSGVSLDIEIASPML